MSAKICPLCQAPLDQKPYISGAYDWEYGLPGEFSFYFCHSCQLLGVDPLPTLNQLKSFYPADYHGFHTANAGVISKLYQIVYRIRFKEYAKLTHQKGKLLDIGCADAAYFDSLKVYMPQLQLIGIEFNEDIATEGRKRGRNIITGTFEEFITNEKFDIIIMNNLIEHLVNPLEGLKKARALLSTGGHIIIETPNIKSFDFLIARKFWGGLHTPRHTFLFAKRSLNRLAQEAGFKITKTKYLLNTDHWALSVQNLLQSFRFSRLKLRNGRAWYYKFLLFVFIPLNAIQVLFRRSGSITITLKKC